MNSQREKFEEAFKRPKFVELIDDEYRMVGDYTPETFMNFMEFCARWQGWQAATEQGVGEAVAEFGNGDWVVEVGGYGDKPTVFVAPADPPGVPGELAPPTSEEDKHRLLDGEWFMTFPTEAQAFAVADALTGRKLKRLDGTRPDDAKPTGGGVPGEWVMAMQRVIDWFDACNEEQDLICPREEYARIKALLATQQPPEQE